jgi:hypothetical protein
MQLLASCDDLLWEAALDYAVRFRKEMHLWKDIVKDEPVEAFLGGATEWGRTLLVLTASRLVLLNKPCFRKLRERTVSLRDVNAVSFEKKLFGSRVYIQNGQEILIVKKVQARYAENFVNTLKARLTARADAENVLAQ